MLCQVKLESRDRFSSLETASSMEMRSVDGNSRVPYHDDYRVTTGASPLVSHHCG